MKIAYFDLHKNEVHEDYSIFPKRYGGAATFARHAKQVLNNKEYSFKIFAMAESFSSYTKEDINNFRILSLEEIHKINNFEPVVDIFPELKDYDIFMFHHDYFSLNNINSKAKNIYWPLVSNSTCHPNNDLMLLYSPNLRCFKHPRTKVDLFRIGVDVPKNFEFYNKEDLIFQCTQHVDTFGSIEVAKECLKHGYKAIFAGPIFSDYKLMDYIDNKYTFYIGQISQEEKISFYKKAKFSTYLHKHETPFNLTLIESMAYGVIPICTKNNFFKSIIIPKYNGFFYDENIVSLLKQDFNSMQINCYATAITFSKEEMIKSFLIAIANNFNLKL